MRFDTARFLMTVNFRNRRSAPDISFETNGNGIMAFDEPNFHARCIRMSELWTRFSFNQLFLGTARESKNLPEQIEEKRRFKTKQQIVELRSWQQAAPRRPLLTHSRLNHGKHE